MNAFNSVRIGTRLAMGFAIVLLLSIVSTSFALINVSRNGEATKRMMERPLAKERLVSDLNLLIYAAIERTTMIAKSTDETLSVVFADEIAAGTKRGGGLLKQVEGMLESEQEKALFAGVMKARGVYQAAKKQIMDAKKAGNTAEAEQVYTKTYTPAAAAYGARVQELLAQQRKAIDDSALLIEQGNGRSFTLIMALSALLVAFGAVFAVLISRSITVPLQAAVAVAVTVANGDLRSSFNIHSRDEIGELMTALKAMNDALANVVSKVQHGTDSIASASSQIASGNADLSSRTESQASSIEQIASTMEELTSTVHQNAENATQANHMAQAASDVALKGGEIVGQVVETMGAIDASSKRIVDIISVIDGIAFQTNILALNAAVEAARAGEEGRGFAVVASEVRSLAQRSASAAKEIKTLIGDSVAQVGLGARLVGQAGTTMADVVASVERVRNIMNDITLASQEQSSGIDQVNQAITFMDEATQQNAALVEQAAAAAASMQDDAAKLAHVAARFKLAEASRPAPRVAARSQLQLQDG
ncbi:MAG: methyl-accepting chemotaxis protein [Massilia sp.]